MIYSLYFRFYELTKSEFVSIGLSYLVRFFFFLRFVFRWIFLKKEKVSFSYEEAVEFLRGVHPEPVSQQSFDCSEKDNDITLSVIVPVYNHIDVVGNCINSILAQKTQYSYEVILVDDGSTDGVQTLIEEYRKYSNVTIIHQENGGIAAARNKGVELAKGRYLMFVDCDDRVKDNLVEDLINEAFQGDYDIVMGAHNLVKMSRNTVTSVRSFIYPQKNLLGYKNHDEIMNYPGLPWAKVYKREMFEQVRFFPGYWYEDTIVHSLLFTQCKSFSYVPKVVYDYFWYEGNFSHVQEAKKDLNPKAVDRYWLLCAIIRRYEALKLPKDSMFYTMLLKHVSAYYYRTIASMPDPIVQAMFTAARELLMNNKPEYKVKLPTMLRITEKAILNNNIALWKLCCRNQ